MMEVSTQVVVYGRAVVLVGEHTDDVKGMGVFIGVEADVVANFDVDADADDEADAEDEDDLEDSDSVSTLVVNVDADDLEDCDSDSTLVVNVDADDTPDGDVDVVKDVGIDGEAEDDSKLILLTSSFLPSLAAAIEQQRAMMIAVYFILKNPELIESTAKGFEFQRNCRSNVRFD